MDFDSEVMCFLFLYINYNYSKVSSVPTWSSESYTWPYAGHAKNHLTHNACYFSSSHSESYFPPNQATQLWALGTTW